MKGIWKSKLFGDDRKNIRRKKQSHKHLLKDNAMFISRYFMEGNIATHPDTFREDKYTIDEALSLFTYEQNSNKFFYNRPAYIHEKHTWTKKERKELLPNKEKYSRIQTKFKYSSLVDYDNEVLPTRQTNFNNYWD